jgi:hypothetical protein
MESWTKHISGAAALLTLRGKQQLKTSIGRQLFVNLRTQVVSLPYPNPSNCKSLTRVQVTNCIQRHVPVPPSIGDWSRAALEFETAEEAASTALSELATKYVAIRSSMSSFSDYRNSEYIIPALLALDAEYTGWVSRCPLSFLYTTVTLKDRSEEVFSDYYHVYSSIGIATVWNHYRCVRILVNELIDDQLNHLFQQPEKSDLLWDNSCGYENQILASMSMLLQLSHDICASVPFYLGYDSSIHPSMREAPKAVSGNLLLWPLYTAAVTGKVSLMMRDWVVGRLMMISEVIGIKQAAPLANSLFTSQDITEWQLEDIDTLEK